MRCRRCTGKAVIKLRAHNTAFCPDCFIIYFRRQVKRAIKGMKMLEHSEPVLVAVSGGKDSLALWDVLWQAGYQTTGLYLMLGIGAYSHASQEKSQRFAESRGLRLLVADVTEGREELGVSQLSRRMRRKPCSVCGVVKRHYFDLMAARHGFGVIATGHNLDDEAARLLANVLRWRTDYLGRQFPVLEQREPSLARKVRPLYRISELETASYAFLRGIDYIVEECPNSAGATQLSCKEALNRLEGSMPGTKLVFVKEFVERAHERFTASASRGSHHCTRCGQPSFAELCSFCRLTGRAVAEER